jgi:hydroxymethylpyrimidine pyrophosphatase-like HAD family hydrolase
MARRLNRLVRIVLSAALVVLSVGVDAQQAFAQTVAGRAAPVTTAPQLGLGSLNAPTPSLAAPVLSLSAPSLSAPSVLSVSPAFAAPVAAAPAALKPVSPAAAIAEKVLAVAPALKALAQTETGGSAAASAGRDLEAVLTGAKTAEYSELSDAVAAGVPSALVPSLSAPSAAPEAPKAAVPAAVPVVQTPKTVESASSYYAHRMALKAIAAMTGAVFSLPQAGAALTAKIIASAADKQLVVSDFDDTLAGYNAVLPQEKIDAVRAIRMAGKHFAVVSDRSDEKRAGSTQLTVFESLASLPSDVTEGMFVAANSGGKLYQYQNGVPVKIWEAEALAAEKLDAVKDASAATVARLAEAGVEQHPGDSLNPKESYNTYGYALMIKVGATPVQMKQVAAIMSEELAKRGIEVEVMGRLPKDPANPGYATFSIITKAPATAKIAEKLGLTPDQTLVIGDMMYLPRAAKKASWLTRLGLKLSGLAIGETGNETDRNMSKGLPGALAIGVGQKMDPRIPNGWNLAGHGPEVTQKVLESVGSKAGRANPSDDGDKVGTAIQLGMIGAIIGMGALGWYALATALGDIVRLGEEALRNWNESPFGHDAGFFLGATTLGMAGMLGAARPRPAGLTHAVEPNDLYALALEKIAEKAATAGVAPEQIKFLSAVHQSRSFNGAWIGDEWRFFFGWGGENGGVSYMVPARRTMVSETMMDAFAPELKGMVSKERLAEGVTASSFDMGVKMSPDAALEGLDGVARVSLLPRVEPVSGGKDLWYSYQDSRDELASMNARTGEVRKAAPAAPGDSALKSFLLWLGGVALVAAIYGGFYWAASNAPVAVPQGIPEGYNGPTPTIDDLFRGMGGVLGLGMLAGTPRSKKAKVTDADIAAAAKSVTASKGGVWSQTEYNMGYYTTLESLKARGASKKQIALYEKLCAEAPVIGGRFNPWSGD